MILIPVRECISGMSKNFTPLNINFVVKKIRCISKGGSTRLLPETSLIKGLSSSP